MEEGDRHRVFIIELDDAFGPRRRPDRPNVFVGITTREPTAQFERIRSGSKRHRAIRDHGIRLREDLSRNYPPTTAADARRQKRKLVEKLMRKGYTVNGDTRVWTLYVIELDDAVGPRADPALPWVYVGETSLTPEERFEQHMTKATNNKGPLYSRVVAKHGLRLRPDLYSDQPLRYTSQDAKIAEALLGERLAAKGYSVKGAH